MRKMTVKKNCLSSKVTIEYNPPSVQIMFSTQIVNKKAQKNLSKRASEALHL